MSSNTPAKKKSKKPKRFNVSVGDLVMFYTCEGHMFGNLAEVTHVIDKNRVVVKCLSPGNTGFTGIETVLLTYCPKGVDKNGEEKHYFKQYITRVIHQVAPPPRPPKKVLPPRVIETTEELIEHLAVGDHRERVIIAPAVTEKSA